LLVLTHVSTTLGSKDDFHLDLSRTTLDMMITPEELMILLGSNHLLIFWARWFDSLLNRWICFSLRWYSKELAYFQREQWWSQEKNNSVQKGEKHLKLIFAIITVAFRADTNAWSLSATVSHYEHCASTKRKNINFLGVRFWVWQCPIWFSCQENSDLFGKKINVTLKTFNLILLVLELFIYCQCL